LEKLLALALKATVRYADSIQDPAKKPRAFWLAHCCTPNNKYLDVNGQVKVIDQNTPNWEGLQDRLSNQDVRLPPSL